jgi:hypothetical protein
MLLFILLCIIVLIILGYLTTVKRREYFTEDPNVLSFYNTYHLGDNIFFGHYITNIADALRTSGKHINYYIEPGNIEAVRDFFPSDIVSLHPIHERPPSAYNEWVGPSRDRPDVTSNKVDLVKFLTDHFNNVVASDCNLPRIETILRSEKRLLDVYEAFDPACKQIDILILNSVPRSGQYANFNAEEWAKMSKYLASKYNVITSEHVPGVKCTRDYNLSLYDIGALSAHVKYIVAVHSGPFATCLTKITFENVKHIYSFEDVTNYDNPKITNAKNVQEIMDVL